MSRNQPQTLAKKSPGPPLPIRVSTRFCTGQGSQWHTLATLKNFSSATLPYFDLLGFDGWGSDLINDNEVAVKMSYDESKREITGTTLGGHQLVGVRKWRLKSSVSHDEAGNRCVLNVTIESESYERTRTYSNWLGMHSWNTEEKQKAVWNGYFTNISNSLINRYGAEIVQGVTSTLTNYGPTRNPWGPGDQFVPQPLPD